VRKTHLGMVGGVVAAALSFSMIPATAADAPGLVPKSSWSSGRSEITIGLEAPMTGVFAVLGISQINSLQVVADQINAVGGIGGAQIKIKALDDGLNPVKAVANAKEFAGDPSISMVVGPSISGFYAAAAPLYEAAKVVNCQPAVSALNFADYTYGFRSQDYYKDTISAVFAELEKRGVVSLGLVYEAGATGQSFNDYMTQIAPLYKIAFLGWQKVSSTATSHNVEMQNFINAGAVWISSNAFGALTAKAAKNLNYKGLIVGGSGLQNNAFQEAGGLDFAGTLMGAPNYQYPVRDRSTWKPGYKLHTETIIAKYGENVGAISGAKSPKGTAIAADCLYAYAVAANKAKSFDSAKVVAAMGSLDIPASMTPSGVRIHPGPEHNFYQQDGISVYQWKHDAKGWYTIELTKGVIKVVAAAKAKKGDACKKIGVKTKNAKGKMLVCKKIRGTLRYQ